MPCETGPYGTKFLTNIYAMKITSNKCLSEVQSLVNSPSKIQAVRNLQGNEAQKFVDFLDQVFTLSRIEGKFRRRGLLLLSKICKARRIIPASYLVRRDLIRAGNVFYRNKHAYVSRGEYSGRRVAIKHLHATTLRINKAKSDKSFKRLCREVVRWKHLSHPNILPLLGVSVSAKSHWFRILTEWMPNGNVIQFAKSNPEANRLKLLSEVMCGVTYLHELKLVHGDLKGGNVLVDGAGSACVADFGLMTTSDQNAVLSSETVYSGGTVFWMGPELLDPARFDSDGRLTCESDCYALGMMIYEVLTGLQPFLHGSIYAAAAAILGGERPEKPLHAESLGLSCGLWELAQACWSELASVRPTARQLLDYLSTASHTWDPPRVYPITRIHTAGSDSSGSSSKSLVTRVVGT